MTLSSPMFLALLPLWALCATFANALGTGKMHAHPRWNDIWQSGIARGAQFDTGSPCPALIKLLSEGEIPEGRALVPGCGRGYDVIALASPTRTCIGMDLSPVAVDAARSFITENAPEISGQYELVAGNFFEYEPEQKFDFIYDYTFLCAIEPEVRGDWARKMKALLTPTGELLTLIFPICDKEGGPPFAMSLELVSSLLVPEGFVAIQLEMLPSELSHAGRDGSGNWGARSGIGRWKLAGA